jgi:hypothetical protein
VVLDHGGQRCPGALTRAPQFLERRALLHAPADQQADADEHDAEQERDAPAPGEELLGRDGRADRGEHAVGQQQSRGRAQLRVRPEQAPPPRRGVLDGEQRRAAPFTARRQPLQDAQEQHDRDHGTAFTTTLLTYLRNFGDVATASAAIHIHQNTLRQRLRRAHELFDLDLDDPAQRLLLEIELAAAAP